MVLKLIMLKFPAEKSHQLIRNNLPLLTIFFERIPNTDGGYRILFNIIIIYRILYIAILIKSIAFNHALTADLPFHAISESRVHLLYSNISNRNMNIFPNIDKTTSY